VLDVSKAAAVDFPLRGEWCAVTTPAERVPSHGTDYFGQRYAYDFAQLNVEGRQFYPSSLFRHIFATLPAAAFF
jgi:hypothetical protein